jgi:hypothetical protein
VCRAAFAGTGLQCLRPMFGASLGTLLTFLWLRRLGAEIVRDASVVLFALLPCASAFRSGNVLAHCRTLCLALGRVCGFTAVGTALRTLR